MSIKQIYCKYLLEHVCFLSLLNSICSVVMNISYYGSCEDKYVTYATALGVHPISIYHQSPHTAK